MRMRPLTQRFLPLGSRRRAWARRVYTKLVALTGRDISTQSASHPPLNPEALADLESALTTSYFNRQPPGYLETERGLSDLANHLTIMIRILLLKVFCCLYLYLLSSY